jgi:hypothetical protein
MFTVRYELNIYPHTVYLSDSCKQPLFPYAALTRYVHCAVRTKYLNTIQVLAVPWLRRLVAGLSPRRPGFYPGSFHVRFVVDKVALGQVFLRVVGFPLSISFHWCSINCKTWLQKLLIFITGVAQEALRLRCVRSICCGALHHAKKIIQMKLRVQVSVWRVICMGNYIASGVWESGGPSVRFRGRSLVHFTTLFQLFMLQSMRSWVCYGESICNKVGFTCYRNWLSVKTVKIRKERP